MVRQKVNRKRIEGREFILKEALEKFIEYYNNHEHSTVKMSPIDAHKEEN